MYCVCIGILWQLMGDPIMGEPAIAHTAGEWHHRIRTPRSGMQIGAVGD